MKDYRIGDSSGTAETEPVVSTPAYCPSCRSADVRTTSKVVSAASYWRCEACGEVWNAGRRKEAARYEPRRWR